MTETNIEEMLSIVNNHVNVDNKTIELLRKMITEKDVVRIRYVPMPEPDSYSSMHQRYEFMTTNHNTPFKILIDEHDQVMLWQPCCN